MPACFAVRALSSFSHLPLFWRHPEREAGLRPAFLHLPVVEGVLSTFEGRIGHVWKLPSLTNR